MFVVITSASCRAALCTNLYFNLHEEVKGARRTLITLNQLSLWFYPMQHWISLIPGVTDVEWGIQRLSHWGNFLARGSQTRRLPARPRLMSSLVRGCKLKCLIISPPFIFSFRLTAKAVAVLLPILGSSWIFGILAVNAHALVFQYIFAVFNSLQVSTWWESLWLL